jgi:hypothetical protein
MILLNHPKKIKNKNYGGPERYFTTGVPKMFPTVVASLV